jgi:GLPGLI family protein
MKKIWITGSLLSIGLCSLAQQKQGSVVYERTSQVRFNIADNNNGEESKVQTRTDKFDLSFGNNQSLWRQAEKDNDDNENVSNNGVQIRMIVAGSDDVLYHNFSDAKKTELRVFFERKFIIDDSIRPLKWKMGEETKTILNHVCRKATATNTSKRTSMTIENGVMERKEIDDTSTITAWFATDIPVSAGPAEFQGQLPGLILALDINNGKQVYRAMSISEKSDVASIKAPSGKKHYTPAEYKKERDKMMEEMQQDNGGGRRQIRIN